jgi:hypothetical protein
MCNKGYHNEISHLADFQNYDPKWIGMWERNGKWGEAGLTLMEKLESAR